MRVWPILKLKLRSKLVLISLVLLLLPWLGLRYIQAMEGLLQQQQAMAMATIAKASAILVEQHPGILRQRTAILEHSYLTPKIVVSQPSEAIVIDGYLNEWSELRSAMQIMPPNDQLRYSIHVDPQDITAQFLWVKQRQSLLLALDIVDDSIVFRDPRSAKRHGSDAIVFAIVDKKQRVRRYLLSASAPGQINAYEYLGSYLDPVVIGRQGAIRASWQLSKYGYRLELAIASEMLDSSLAVAVVDVDKGETEPVVIGLGDVRDRAHFADLLLAAPELNDLLSAMATDGTRLWLLDKHRNTLASAGQGEVLIAEQTINSVTDFFYNLFLEHAVSDDESLDHKQAVFQGEAVQRALSGKATTERRKVHTTQQTVIVAAQPVFVDGMNMGVLVAEKNTNDITGLQNEAVKALLNTSLGVIALALIILLGFASWLSYRIRRLNQDVFAMVSGEGRVSGSLKQRAEYDEIGELRQGFELLFERLRGYTHYLEALSSRLTHELRTPIAVIRTSLEHLEHAPEKSQTYIERARSGSDRLNNIIARMSEASRLEQTVHNVVFEDFDLTKLLRDITAVYHDLYSDVHIELELADQAIIIHGSQDLIVQMLDKLLANAVDFHQPDTPVRISLNASNAVAKISIKNTGPALPENMEQHVFEPMVSIREISRQSNIPHLGLGLYIVKLIVQQHKGRISAENWQQGVEFQVELPIAKV